MNICKERAFELLKKISFERIAGTPEEMRCAEIIKEECEKAGVPAVIESFEIDTPEIFEAKMEVTKPQAASFNCIGIGKSGVTPDEGVCGPLLYVENGLETNFTDAKGKILLFTGTATEEVMERMRKSGALGYIAIHGSLFDAEEMIPELRTRNERRKPEVTDNFPGVVIHITDAQKLLRMNPEEVRIVVKQDGDKKGTSHNVIATIEGTEKPEEIVSFSAHFDSVIYSSGAWDNGTGTVTIMELMHHFAKNPPKRTLKFVWCGSEEIGLVGSKAYCNDHIDEMKDYLFDINVDMTGVLLGYNTATGTCDESVMKYIDFLGKVEGYPVQTNMEIYPSDSTSFSVIGDVPSITFARQSPKGGAEIHSRHDIFDTLDADAFIKTVEFMAKFSDTVVNATVFPVPREMPKDLKEKLEERKKTMCVKKEENAEEKKDEEKK